jgi:maltooligosyltrehalose trehalohydrolase
MAINRIGYDGTNNIDQVKEAEPIKTSLEAPPPIAQAQPTAPSAEKFARRPTMKSALLRSQLQARLDAGKSVAVDSIKAAALAEPVKRSVTFVYDAGPHSEITNLQLKGSWNKTTGEYDPQWGRGDSVPMRQIGNGKWAVTLDLLDRGEPQNWEWGVIADGPAGKGQWAVMGEGNPKFKLDAGTKTVSYTPTTYHEMGAQKTGKNDISFKFWAPNAQHVSVKTIDQNGRVRLIPMKRDAEGNWTAKSRGGWSRLEGKAYVYQVIDSDGKTLERPDPYARVMQGEQQGIGRTYVNLKTGEQTNQFYIDPEVYQQFKDQIEGNDPELAETARQRAREMSRAELVRFEVEDQENVDSAYLVFKDEMGRQLSRTELINRLGRFDSKLIDKLHGGKFNDLWSNNIDEKGRIKLVNQGGTWAGLVNNLEKLTGLRYEFQVYERDAQGKLKLKGDRNLDGQLSSSERKGTGYNDRWSDTITKESGRSFRASVISDTKFDWKSDTAVREKDQDKWVIYQLHVGSFFGKEQNANRSTFEDVIKKLDYFKGLGVNTLEILPTNEFEGERDWGYMGANSLAVESAYGFEDENGRWVSGAEGLKRFIDMAHERGLNVINDVVYNHVGGANNFLWNIDGKQNPYFNWSTEPGKFEKRDTQWGAMPAFNNPKVRQFFVDHAVAQLEEFHFDGLRFDFTEPIKATWGGGEEGREMLREMNRQLHFYKPDAFIAAEQFDYDPDITKPAQSDGSGVGFDAQWYTEFQHRLVRDNSNPGLIQQAAQNQRTDMDQFMNMLVNPRGLGDWSKAVTIISDHDEVGNAQRTIDTADGDSTAKIPPQWARNAARFAAGIGLAAPGVPMFFQGDESMAQNSFKWGVPSTWDSGWDWETTGKSWDWNNLTFNDNQKRLYNRLFEMPETEREKDSAYRNLSASDRQVFQDLAAMNSSDREQTMLNITRHQSYQFYKEALALRASSPAFEADAQVARVYTHNDNSVMAFTRKDGNEEFLVVGSLNHNNLQSYRMELPAGQWKEVFNSDAGRFGGNNFGNFGATINGGPSQVNIPAGGYVVFKRV